MLNSDTSDPETRRGVFTSIEQLDSYEKLWHTRVYRPSRDEMTEKVRAVLKGWAHFDQSRFFLLQFIQYSNVMQHAVFVEMRYGLVSMHVYKFYIRKVPFESVYTYVRSYEHCLHMYVRAYIHAHVLRAYRRVCIHIRDVIYVQIVVAPSCRSLELCYPHYPTEQDFTHSVLSSGDVVREDIALLSRFSLQWRRLQAGGELLPDLVELYQWLHTDLAHLVSYDKACTVTIRKVINRAVKKYSRDRGQYLEQLFVRVKGEPP